MKPKIQDVARLAGVSPTTVSRVLNDRGYISDETREKVNKAMKELNYFPNDVARSLFNKRTNLIGVILPTVSNPFFGELTFYIENICNSLGYKILLCNSLNNIDNEERYLEMLMRNQVDGIIVGTHNQGILEYKNDNMAVVSIDTDLSENIPIIGSDNYNGGKIATELLLSKGCKNIINIDGEFNLRTQARLRKIAYEDVMKSNNRIPITYEIVSTFDGGNQIQIANKILDEHPEVDGVFATNDLFAAAFINEARKRGRKIPEDLKIVGYDGTETSRSLLPDLTTIKQPIELIAKTSIELLIKEIEGDFSNRKSKIALPVSLIEGKTT
ncbi:MULTISPECIES: LacI family DNA-binding transcriptional regulator [Clostridium]|uniref:LacI family transcriptional regulator n=1 Tax=Clostridium butyricum TaxID=1492 RepID=A0AAP9UGX4_CLOBU|nr:MULTISPECIES: LacI family DNA-binding transcriptional regulator [Clostridium]MDU4853737.1 LacI family DNA-binding transcriptional regulator [Clostridioides difficile]MBS4841256.1 LacI family DNA-binding transcriptional regulator [Clostridium sp.]MBS5983337.1 LacI family DNA-binding transcriptional regulator [Clostridium butyricum]MBZ5748119.1 LacI family DNA-binding transcriptional regulator [Clostridium butyricum]MDU1403490.1 LacI family DNA-binding transcriptional regulator [Clostridium s